MAATMLSTPGLASGIPEVLRQRPLLNGQSRTVTEAAVSEARLKCRVLTSVFPVMRVSDGASLL